MLVDLTPPIRSEAVGGAGAERAAFGADDDWLDPKATETGNQQAIPAQGDGHPDPLRDEPEPVSPGPEPGQAGPDRDLLIELQTLRQRQAEEAHARQELLLTFEARERELKARLEAAQGELEAGRSEVAYLRQHREVQRLRQERLEQQQQAQLRDLQQALVGARLEISSGHADNASLRQRNSQLQEQRDQLERQSQNRISQLEQELAGSRHDLITALADLEALRQRGDELTRRHEQNEGEARLRLSQLEQELEPLRHSHREQEEQLKALQQERDALLAQEQGWRQRLEAAAEGLIPPAPSPPAIAGEMVERLQRERIQLEEDVMALHRLLEELPEIYEGKFRQRLQPLLEQRDWLLRENGWLRAVLQPAASEETTTGKARPRLLPALPSRPRLRQGLQALLQLARPAGAARSTVRDGTPASPDDDGQPTAASAAPTHR